MVQVSGMSKMLRNLPSSTSSITDRGRNLETVFEKAPLEYTI